MSRLRYFVSRTLQTVALLALIITFLFVLFRLMPGDQSDILLYQGASPQGVEAFRERWRLDEPLHVQYWAYMTNFVQGDVGYSMVYRIPVWEHVRVKIFNTFILVAPSMTVGYVVGTTLGMLMGNRRGSLLEKYGIIPFITIGTTPVFFTSLVAVVLFSSWLGIFPSSGMLSSNVALDNANATWWTSYFTSDFLMHYILPASVIALRYVYEPLLIMRTSVIDTTNQGFVFFDRLTGLSRFTRLKHIARHSIIPVVTFYPITMGRAISGLVLVEVVFNWPGIGFALVQAVLSQDYPVIQFVFFLAAAWVIIGNYLIDILYGVIDPRISVGD